MGAGDPFLDELLRRVMALEAWRADTERAAALRAERVGVLSRAGIGPGREPPEDGRPARPVGPSPAPAPAADPRQG
jgi:hypothetical protein